MKKYMLGALLLISAASLQAQTIGNEALPQLKDGLLDLKLGSEDNNLRFGGFIQMNGYWQDVRNAQSEYGFNIDHALVNLEGSFFGGKLGFFLQADFADSYPLLDAWVSYAPVKPLKISVGQKQTFTGTRQMMFLDAGLAFGHRSLLEQTFFDAGRELGVFVESRIGWGCGGFDLGLAVTSGDGRNSFGSSSTDPDKGGLKYGGRISFYPLGFFTAGNEKLFNDFAREQRPRLALGAAFSYNDGASNAKGEGHGDFTLYDADGQPAYPDYRKLSADLLFKWQGFSLLLEYENASATRLDGLCTAASQATALRPRQIANYLALGDGVNLQAGYLFRNLWAIDLAYSKVMPEWPETESSIVRDADCFTAGVAKYFRNNTFKVQLSGSYLSYGKTALAENATVCTQLSLHFLF